MADDAQYMTGTTNGRTETCRPSRRRASVIVYSVVLTVVLVAVCSLAVDYGRVQSAKSEMQRAVFAAARAGVVYLPTDIVGAKNAAIAVAAMNSVDGQPLVVQFTDVEVGSWDTSTQTFNTSGVPNAMRITARRTTARGNPVPRPFAEILGLPGQDLTVRQTTFYQQTPPGGIIGYNGITVKNNLFAAGYNSDNTTSPSMSNSTAGGGLGSNAVISGFMNSTLNGNAILGPTGSVSGVTVTGSKLVQSAALTPPPQPAWVPGANPNNIPMIYTVSSSRTLPGGTYWFTSLSVSGTLTFSGPTTFYINGNAAVSGSLLAYQNIPRNLKIYMIGARVFGDGNANDVDVTADIEAPYSAFIVKNNLYFRGRMLFDTITVKNNAEMFYDEFYGPSDGRAILATVAN